MPSTRDIRRRIKSIKNTSQITKAMQMIAATKMRKAQQAALAGRPYAELMNHIMKSAEQRVSLDHPLMEKREVKTVGVLLISTDKGLCGGLNTNLLRVASKYDPASTSFVTMGRKGRAFVARTKRNLLADFEMSDAFTFADARSSAKFVMDLYTEKKVDRVDVLYTNFVNTLTQRPDAAQLLPVSPGSVAAVELTEAPEEPPQGTAKETGERADYEYEPDANEVLGAILPHYVNFQVWHFMLEAKASEQSARMVAMQNATENAKQLVKDLTLEYNKIRQASITNELLEITTAQMALG